jgi:hypothetical protein
MTEKHDILGKYVLSDLDVGNVKLPTKTPWGPKVFQDRLRTPTSDTAALRKRQLPLLALKSKSSQSFRSTCKTELETIARHANAWNDFQTDMDPRVRESIEQIMWSKDSMGSFLNTTPRVVGAIVFWKTLFLPIVSLVLPILAIVLPLILLRFVHGTPISTRAYFENLKGIALKQVAIPTILRAKHDADVLGQLFEWIFFGLTVATFVSSLWTQITSALHLRTIAHEIAQKGDDLLAMIQAAERIVESSKSLEGPTKRALGPVLRRGSAMLETFASMPRSGGYATYGFLWNTPDIASKFGEWIGELDILLAIADSPVCIPKLRATPTPLSIHGVYHPGIVEIVRNDAVWEKSHAILTGPNRGGKSTFCRSVGLAILCAQSWGFAFAQDMSFSPYTYIETALHPADTLGQLSLFEAEIEFAKIVLQRAKEGRMFVMMDEIFHSTNARDGLAASRVFLSQLYEFPITSLISTHYKELPTEYTDVLAWAMEAKEDIDRNCLLYTYKKVPGISDKSSVMEILRERGLVGRG